ncbi:3-oxoacyl-ACP reductase [Terrimonas sp.]|uniref:SDR family NAD(P)-dependent oxidoreductase n=1 Tax=Terrimonas sp. TaxID=1914338 RepID=UPI000D506384|nr:SDR family NAD(P)-dependent oxidoreductase [Terrimonas sp.]PVD52046.1 3-oxoacyl-ACP reductase [Terrimonas sp.]
MKVISPSVLILGANADVAKAAIPMYIAKGYGVIAASRSTGELQEFALKRQYSMSQMTVLYFDAAAFETHQVFYDNLPAKPAIVVYAAGFLKNNEEALRDWKGSFNMMKVHYCGAVSILNIIAMDESNQNLKRIIGVSSLSGVRGRKSNFIYGSTKSAFTQYLAGLRQYLFSRNIQVNVIVAGYIQSKMTAGLDLPESLMLEPSFIAKAVVNAGRSFVIVPGFKWKMIYHILRLMPERLVAKLP